MPLFILLSDESDLVNDLENALNQDHESVNVLLADSWSVVESFLSSLQDIQAVFIDLDSCPPPKKTLPNLIGLASEILKPNQNFPVVNKALLAQNLAQSLHDLNESQTAFSRNDSPYQIDEFMGRLLKEVAHDINNQFTVLSGQLPLLKSDYPEEADVFDDLITATHKASKLIHLLEGFIPHALPGPQVFNFNLWLKDFNHFAVKIYPTTFSIENTVASEELQINGDPDFLSALLLKICWLYPPNDQPLCLRIRQLDSQTLELEFITAVSQTHIDTQLETAISSLQNFYNLLGVSLTISSTSSLTCHLPIEANG